MQHPTIAQKIAVNMLAMGAFMMATLPTAGHARGPIISAQGQPNEPGTAASARPNEPGTRPYEPGTAASATTSANANTVNNDLSYISSNGYGITRSGEITNRNGQTIARYNAGNGTYINASNGLPLSESDRNTINTALGGASIAADVTSGKILPNISRASMQRVLGSEGLYVDSSGVLRDLTGASRGQYDGATGVFRDLAGNQIDRSTLNDLSDLMGTNLPRELTGINASSIERRMLRETGLMIDSSGNLRDATGAVRGIYNAANGDFRTASGQLLQSVGLSKLKSLFGNHLPSDNNARIFRQVNNYVAATDSGGVYYGGNYQRDLAGSLRGLNLGSGNITRISTSRIQNVLRGNSSAFTSGGDILDDAGRIIGSYNPISREIKDLTGNVVRGTPTSAVASLMGAGSRISASTTNTSTSQNSPGNIVRDVTNPNVIATLPVSARDRATLADAASTANQAINLTNRGTPRIRF